MPHVDHTLCRQDASPKESNTGVMDQIYVLPTNEDTKFHAPKNLVSESELLFGGSVSTLQAKLELFSFDGTPNSPPQKKQTSTLWHFDYEYEGYPKQPAQAASLVCNDDMDPWLESCVDFMEFWLDKLRLWSMVNFWPSWAATGQAMLPREWEASLD